MEKTESNDKKLIGELNKIVDQIRGESGLDPLDHQVFAALNFSEREELTETFPDEKAKKSHLSLIGKDI